MKPKNFPSPKQPAPSGTAGLLRTACAMNLLLLLLLPLPAGAQADYRYTTDNGTITITKYEGTNDAVAIPDTIDGLPVTSVGDYAFFFATRLTSVTIPSGVTSIGEGRSLSVMASRMSQYPAASPVSEPRRSDTAVDWRVLQSPAAPQALATRRSVAAAV